MQNQIDNENFLNYLNATTHFLKVPRLHENDFIKEQFQTLASSILGPDFNEYVMVIECFTTDVFPRNIHYGQKNIILWDSNFWDIYGRFLYMFFAYLKSGNYITKDFFSNYYESLLFIYLSNAFERKPALARYIAEEYLKLENSFPSYDKQEDIEKLLSEIGHLQEFNIAKRFP